MYEPKGMKLVWYESRLNISAEHDDNDRNRNRTYHRFFRFSKDIDEGGHLTTYESGVFEMTLPALGETTRGTSISIEC